MKPLRAADVANAEPIGLRGPGRRLPSTLQSLARRDRLLREAAARLCGQMSAHTAAWKLASELERYRSTAWRRDAAEPKCPARHRGTLRECFWLILRTRDAPLSSRTIRRALSYSWPRSSFMVVVDK